MRRVFERGIEAEIELLGVIKGEYGVLQKGV